MIPYGRQTIDDDDIAAVVDVLKSDWLTTGPKVTEFENRFAEYVGAQYAVAVSSGTAALHCAMKAIGIGPGDEVILSPITFAATANCIVYQGGKPLFTDVLPNTALLDPDQVEKNITPRTRAIIAVDYAGHPCDYDRLKSIAEQHHLHLVADACHTLGARYKDAKVGSIADLSVFSFHPVKHITTGEGGMITTDSPEFRNSMRMFRNHGISTDFRDREKQGTWHYEMIDLGYNFRITDFQCALGISQLNKIDSFVERRRKIALKYTEALSDHPKIKLLTPNDNVHHSYHLFVVRVMGDRKSIFLKLRQVGIGVNVHYMPVYYHPFYQRKFKIDPGLCPVAEKIYQQVLSLPMYPGMRSNDVDQVVAALEKTVK